MIVLQLTAHFRPNIGGLETHLDDLCEVLIEKNINVIVLTYSPLHTKTSWKVHEKKTGLEIIRVPWIPNLFYAFIKLPFLEFIYLLPGLFFVTPLIIFLKKIEVIHAHGLVAGFIGVFWGRFFRKRVIISTHSIYSFPEKGLYRNFVSWIFNNASFILGLSERSVAEIISLGSPRKKVGKFTYWVDLNNFRKIDDAKKLLGWGNDFNALFVGRLVEEKGVNELLDALKILDKKIKINICGSGPLSKKIQLLSTKFKNLNFLGVINKDQLPVYYSASDILIIPSISEEGFGRVIIESLACGTPVLGSNRGAIPEAIDSSVGFLFDVNKEDIKKKLEYLYYHQQELRKLSKNCRNFAERRYSKKNVETIIKAYQG